MELFPVQLDTVILMVKLIFFLENFKLFVSTQNLMLLYKII